MTSGERMIWAAEFVRARAAGFGSAEAVGFACTAIHALKVVMERDPEISSEDRAMVDDMLGNGADR